jgi:hypothetical protein
MEGGLEDETVYQEDFVLLYPRLGTHPSVDVIDSGLHFFPHFIAVRMSVVFDRDQEETFGVHYKETRDDHPSRRVAEFGERPVSVVARRRLC